jgi:hypothetical protein
MGSDPALELIMVAVARIEVARRGGGGRKSQVGRDDVCAYCGKKGHWAKECRKKKCDKAAQAHMAHGEEEEQSLLLAHNIVLDKSPVVIVNTTAVAHSSPLLAPHCAVHIEEQQVFTNLGPAEENDHNR